jgi:hypothetical protein
MDKTIAEIIAKVTRSLVVRFGKGFLAISLVGAVARGEETWINGKLAGDVDLLLITKRTNLFAERKIAESVKDLTCDSNFAISVGCIPLKNLKKMKDLETYECKESGKLIWGDKNVFDNIPIKRPEEIPKWEGIRLLLNRVFEQLQASCGEKSKTYAIAKTYLAIGEAYLIFDGRYRCSYKERLDQIRTKCNVGIVENFPEKFEQCSRYKLNKCSEMNLTFDEAREDLLNAISFFLSTYNGSNLSINQNVTKISRHFYSASHSACFFIKKAVQKDIVLKSLLKEPCFIIWEEAIGLLRENSIQIERIKSIVRDWYSTPQVLVC